MEFLQSYINMDQVVSVAKLFGMILGAILILAMFDNWNDEWK